ncbi:MAG: RIP metalloprotease RseP [Candidatus Gastranaerophilaceae bacterium]
MSIIIMILLLSILILVHEAGHFLAARMFGIKVEKFGFGLPIGPTLFEKQCGDTTVVVHAFLLGGYVAFPDDEKDSDLPKNSPDRFLNRPVYQRMIVISAGVIANIICAFAFVLLTALLWGHLPSGQYDIYIKNITAPKNESVWNSGMQKGDKLQEINGTKTVNGATLITFAKMSKRNDGKVDSSFAEKNYQKLKAINPAFTKDEIIPEGITVKLPAYGPESQIKLNKNEILGLQKIKDTQVELTDTQKQLRDEIANRKYYESNGKVTLNDIAYAMSDNSRPLNITVIRDGKEVKLKPIYPDKNGKIGVEILPKEVLMTVNGPVSALKLSTKYLADQTYLLLYGLKQIFTGQIPLKELHGIVAITKIGGDTISNPNGGIFYGLLLTAIISMDLAIVNFLPIPALDGGHFLFLIIEKLRGRPLDEDTVNLVGNIGFSLLIFLMVIVVFNDIYALVTHKF